MADKKMILSGDGAIAYGAKACGVTLGAGYPGTPSTEILETLTSIGGAAQWSPNEKVALEVATGVSLGNGRALVTMKHVGLNVAADPLFTLTYMGVNGGLVIVSADDPGMVSSQNEQDNRNYAKFAQMPMLEPSSSQEAYDLTIRAFELSEQFKVPVLLRMTTRVCHSMGPVALWKEEEAFRPAPYKADPTTKVMIPAYARRAHVRLIQVMKDLAAYNESSDLHTVLNPGSAELGVLSSGVSVQHVLEAAPEASVLQLKMTWPLPLDAIRKFASGVKRFVVVEEGSKFLEENLRAAGIAVEGKEDVFECGELSVGRVKQLLAHDTTPPPAGAPGRPPALCPGCPHRKTFELLSDLKLTVLGDIGCYTLGVLPPFNAMDASECMGASIGMGLGLRRSLGDTPEARRVVSVIGDSTFLHSGLTGVVDMVYNKPATGHVVLLLDNGTTAMTGLQEHAATGYHLDKTPAVPIKLEDVCRSLGVDHVDVVDPVGDNDGYRALLQERLASNDATVIIVRRPCLMQMKKMAKMANHTEVKK